MPSTLNAQLAMGIWAVALVHLNGDVMHGHALKLVTVIVSVDFPRFPFHFLSFF
jgi:hypothetical protein